MGKVLKFWVIFKAFSSKTVTNKFTFSKKNSIRHDLLYLIAVALYETPINSSNILLKLTCYRTGVCFHSI